MTPYGRKLSLVHDRQRLGGLLEMGKGAQRHCTAQAELVAPAAAAPLLALAAEGLAARALAGAESVTGRGGV